MAIENKQIQFRTADIDEVLEVMAQVEADEKSWVTIAPWIDAHQMPVTSVLRKLFSGRGPKVPAVNWVPHAGHVAELGIRHGAGPKAAQRLLQAGITLPAGSIVIADHPRRGLVLQLAPETTHQQILDFAVTAAADLSQVATDDRWLAEVSTPQ